jgi:hypothetical protein
MMCMPTTAKTAQLHVKNSAQRPLRLSPVSYYDLRHIEFVKLELPIEQPVLDTNAGKQQS